MASPAAATTAAATSAAASSGPAPSSCVSDVDKVVARTATPASMTAALPDDLVARLDAAGQESFKVAAAPGAIVGVRTAQSTRIKACGDADPVAKAPMSDDMHIRIGSRASACGPSPVPQLRHRPRVHRRWVGHTGELPGYDTAVYYDSTSDTSIVVQTNSDIASGDCPSRRH